MKLTAGKIRLNRRVHLRALEMERASIARRNRKAKRGERKTRTR